jgi:hypothetical protein
MLTPGRGNPPGALIPKKIDLAKPAPADALDLGVLIEDEARERYDEFAVMMRDVHHNLVAAEIKAEKFYKNALPGMPKGDLRDLFTELAAQEVEHQRLIADMMAKLPPAEDLQREDVADEPVSQD